MRISGISCSVVVLTFRVLNFGQYIKNITCIIEYIEEILTNLTGKRVITRDHGNYAGERVFWIPTREYAHPHGMYDDPNYSSAMDDLRERLTK